MRPNKSSQPSGVPANAEAPPLIPTNQLSFQPDESVTFFRYVGSNDRSIVSLMEVSRLTRESSTRGSSLAACAVRAKQTADSTKNLFNMRFYFVFMLCSVYKNGHQAGRRGTGEKKHQSTSATDHPSILKNYLFIRLPPDGFIIRCACIMQRGMMTARLASGYGRGVFVVPGRIDDVRSGGCNVLLAEKVAEPIVSTASLAEALGLGAVKGDGMPDLESVISARFLEKAGAEETEKMKKNVKLIRISRGIDMYGISRTTGSE